VPARSEGGTNQVSGCCKLFGVNIGVVGVQEGLEVGVCDAEPLLGVGDHREGFGKDALGVLDVVGVGVARLERGNLLRLFASFLAVELELLCDPRDDVPFYVELLLEFRREGGYCWDGWMNVCYVYVCMYV